MFKYYKFTFEYYILFNEFVVFTNRLYVLLFLKNTLSFLFDFCRIFTLKILPYQNTFLILD